MAHAIRMRGCRHPVARLVVSMYWVGKDLDLSCVLLSGKGEHCATVSFLDETFAVRCLAHSGDVMDGTNGAKVRLGGWGGLPLCVLRLRPCSASPPHLL